MKLPIHFSQNPAGTNCRAQRQKAKRDARSGCAIGKYTVENFMGSTVTADREEATVSLIVGLPGELHSVARASGSNYIDLQPLLA